VRLKSNALQALSEANLCGHDAVEEMTSGVAGMQVQASKPSLLGRIMGKLSPSLLGFPGSSAASRKKQGTRKLGNPSTSSAPRRSECLATKASTTMTNRKAQASACKQLGLICREEDFNDAIREQYLKLFQHQLPQESLQGLAALTEVTSRPAFVLHEGQLSEFLRESTYVD